MATVRPQFDVHNSSLRPVSLVSLLIFCPLGLASMLWSNVSEGRICIPTLCLKYLVIFIANALLATGWLFVVRNSQRLSHLCSSLIASPQSF